MGDILSLERKDNSDSGKIKPWTPSSHPGQALLKEMPEGAENCLLAPVPLAGNTCTAFLWGFVFCFFLGGGRFFVFWVFFFPVCIFSSGGRVVLPWSLVLCQAPWCWPPGAVPVLPEQPPSPHRAGPRPRETRGFVTRDDSHYTLLWPLLLLWLRCAHTGPSRAAPTCLMHFHPEISIHPPPFHKKHPWTDTGSNLQNSFGQAVLVTLCVPGSFDIHIWMKWELTVSRHCKRSATKDSCNYLLSEFILSALHGANVFRNPEDEKLRKKPVRAVSGHDSFLGGRRNDSQGNRRSQKQEQALEIGCSSHGMPVQPWVSRS